MEAWILHIHEESMSTSKTGNNQHRHRYSAWATEKQALKAAANYLSDEATNYSTGSLFINRTALMNAVQGLLEGNHIQAAIGLVNKYTQPDPPLTMIGAPGVEITITKSVFLGSAFE